MVDELTVIRALHFIEGIVTEVFHLLGIVMFPCERMSKFKKGGTMFGPLWQMRAGGMPLDPTKNDGFIVAIGLKTEVVESSMCQNHE